MVLDSLIVIWNLDLLFECSGNRKSLGDDGILTMRVYSYLKIYPTAFGTIKLSGVHYEK